MKKRLSKIFAALSVCLILPLLFASCGKKSITKQIPVSCLNPWNLGQTGYKEFTVNGETISVLVETTAIDEYSADGKERHTKVSDGFEWWAEFDDNGQQIHFKNSKGYENWWEYNSNGNQIHYKDSDGYENWHEYDSKGHEIHYKSSGGSENWSEYDAKGNRIYYKDSDGHENWYEYDSHGNEIHVKSNKDRETWYEYKYDSKGNKIYSKETRSDYDKTFEAWYEYDKKGNLIHHKNYDGYEYWYEYDKKGNEIYYKNSDGKEEWYDYDEYGYLVHHKEFGHIETWYEYEFYPDGKVKSRWTYAKRELLPKKNKFYMTSDNLKIRSAEGTDSEVLYVLPKDTRVFVKEVGKEQEIDGQIASWANVVIEECTDLNGKKIKAGQTGWCFGGFLYRKDSRDSIDDKEIESFLKAGQSLYTELAEYGPTTSINFEQDSNRMRMSRFDIDFQRTIEYKYKIENGVIVIEPETAQDEEDDDNYYLYRYPAGSILTFKYDIDSDNYLVEELSLPRKPFPVIVYDEEAGMLIEKNGSSTDWRYSNTVTEDCILYSKPDTASKKVTYKEIFTTKETAYKVFNLNRIFAGQAFNFYAKSLYPDSEGRYWYITYIGVLEHKKAYFLTKNTLEDRDIDYTEVANQCIEKIKELAAQGELKIEELSDDEKDYFFRAKGLLVDIYGSFFNDSQNENGELNENIILQ